MNSKNRYSLYIGRFQPFHDGHEWCVRQMLDETGTINVGGKSQSVYDFVKEENNNIKPIYLKDISDVNMATDCSMDTTKMKKVIGEL